MRFNTCIFSFPSYFLPIHSSFHLRGKKPFKWTPTKKPSSTTTTIKHLAVERPIFVFTKCDKSNGATLFPAKNQIRTLARFILGWFVYGKVLPRRFDLPLANWNCDIMVCLSVHRANCLVEPRSLKKWSILYVLVKFLHLSASPCLYLASEIELLQGNGNRAECCGTSFSHTTTV